MAATTSKKRKLAQSQERVQNGKHESALAPPVSSANLQKAFFKSAAGWDLEHDYEDRKRKDKKRRKKESTRLPIKTADGWVQPEAEDVADDISVESDGDWLEKLGEPEEEPEDAGAREVKKGPQKPEQEQIREAQEELAKIATGLNEDPEEHAGAFKALAQIGESDLEAVRKITMVAQMAVYKDIIPGYRIRPLNREALDEKVSKEVRKLRQYEQALVAGYQVYVKKLAQSARLPSQPAKKREAGKSLANVAIECACTLLTAVPHFNFRGDLIKIVVGPLSRRRRDADFVKCRTTLEDICREDEEGRSSFEVVSTLTKMIRARDFKVDELVLDIFLHLRLLSEFSGKASQDHVEKNGAPIKVKKKHREFRSKKEKKAIKEQKALAKDMAEVDALVSHEEREKMQSETLKLVFGTYFRILKARTPHLMGAVLEGLARYAHLINQDFFGDLLEALKDLIRDTSAMENENGTEKEGIDGAGNEEDNDEDEATSRNTSRESILCTITAYALLAGQDAHNSRSNLHLDLSFFNSQLYKSLLPLSIEPALERTSKAYENTSGTADASTPRNKVNIQTTTVLLIRCLTSILLPPWNIRSVPPLRLASFTKQLMTASLHMPEKSIRAVLALLADVADAHAKKVSALWNTEHRIANGTFNPLTDYEGSNPFSATVWEGEILRRHFSPSVREGVKIVEKAMTTSK